MAPEMQKTVSFQSPCAMAAIELWCSSAKLTFDCPAGALACMLDCYSRVGEAASVPRMARCAGCLHAWSNSADASDLCPVRLTWQAACLQTQIILMNADMYNEGTVALFDAGHIDTQESPYAASTAFLKVGHWLLSLQLLLVWTHPALVACKATAAADAVPCRQPDHSWVLPARAADAVLSVTHCLC